MFKTLTPQLDHEDDLQWQVDAACLGVNPLLFDSLPPSSDPFDSDRVQEALSYCAECPVRVQCLRQAANTPGAVGVWGGGYIPESGFVNKKRERERPRVWLSK